MCEVWRGQHRHQGTPVAIKIVLANHARRDRYIRTFRDEVRAVASLQHPYIIQVFDYGQIPATLPESAPAQLIPGSPYLVMELADDTLRSWCGQLDWPQLYQVLLSLLDALAHAHAQGVIHRDIKPGNILQCQSGTIIKLTDFGLAHTFYGEDNEQESEEIIGTPAYMAPEQFERRWRDYGPWTDLYALGCTAYALLTGEPPFGQLENLEEIMRSHLFRAVPTLPQPEQVPPHFEQWLRCLLAKSPTARFQRAADAAWALMELSRDWKPPAKVFVERTTRRSPQDAKPEPSPNPHTRQSRPPSPWDPHTLSGGVKTTGVLPFHEVPALPMLRSLHQASTLHIKTDLPELPHALRESFRESVPSPASEDRTRLNRPTVEPLASDGSVPLASQEATLHLKPLHRSGHFSPLQVLSEIPSPLFQRPPLVEDWRRSEEEPLTPPLHDVGLGLYGLRAIPWAGREQERDQLWQILLQVCRKQVPHAIFLQGPAGCGKSRLARWLCERAHEVGTATYLKTQFHTEAEMEDGFEASLLRYLRGMELAQDDLLERLYLGEGHRLGLSHDECEAIARWLCPPAVFAPSYSGFDAPASVSNTPRDTLLFAVNYNSSEWLATSWKDSGDEVSAAVSSEHDTQPTEDNIPAGQPYPSSSSEENPLWMDEETWYDKTFSAKSPLSVPSAVREQHRLFFRFLHRLSLRRPVILWIDDVHENLNALSFLQYVFQQSLTEPCPLLVVSTLRDDILAEQPEIKIKIAQLQLLPDVSRLCVGPLPPEHHTILVRNLLGLQGELAAQVEKRTAGNPMFAVQLVGDWVQRGLLEPTEQGFCLKPNVAITIPDNLYQVWQTRLARVLENRTSQEKMVLELAAALGHQVDFNEWLAVCQIVGEPLPFSLLEQLLEQQLARRTSPYSENWSFAHAMLQESLQRQALEANRLQTHHWICAIMLQRKSGRGIAERLGRHLKLAGKSQDALSPLLQGLRERESSGEYHQAVPLLQQWEELLHHMSWPPDHPYWGELRLLQSQLARGFGNLSQTLTLAQQVYQDAQTYHWPHITIQALLLMVHAAMRQGHPTQGIENWLNEALDLAQAFQHPSLIAETVWLHGEFLCLRGRGMRAETYFHRAFEHFSHNNDTLGMGRSHYGLALAAKQQGHFDQAQYHLELAQRYFEAYHGHRGTADCLRLLGDLCRVRKQFSPALDYYGQGQQIYQRLGAGDLVLCDMGLGLVALQQQDYAKAQSILEGVLQTLLTSHNHMWAGAVHVFLLVCAAHQQDWPRWQRHRLQAETLLNETQLHDIDLADMAQQAAILAEQYHAHTEAEAMYRLALGQWVQLNHLNKTVSLRERWQNLISKHNLPQPAASVDTPPKGTPLPHTKLPESGFLWINPNQDANTSQNFLQDPLGPTQRTSNPLLDDESDPFEKS